jgi:tetratricopeptide (TPR) repeat protein
VRLDNRNGQARYKLGRAHAANRDLPHALEHLVRAADLLPTDEAVQLDAVRVLLLAGRYEDGMTRAEGVLARNPKNTMAHVLRASAMAGMSQIDEALTSLEDAIKIDPNRPGSFMDLGTVQAARGNLVEAEAGFKHAITVDPKAVPAYLALARFYSSTDRQMLAEQTVLQALDVDAADRSANVFLARIYATSGRMSQLEAPLKRMAAASKSPQARMMLADYFVQQKRFAEARPILEELSSVPEVALPARLRIAGLEYEGGMPAKAHKLIDALIAEQPSNVQIQVIKAGWLLSEKKVAEAMKRASAVAAANPSSADAMMLLAAVQLAAKDGEAAFRSYNEVLRLSPGSVEAQVALANLNLDRGKPKEAADFARLAVTAAPSSGAARLALSRALLAQGQFDQARTELQPVLAAAPANATVLTVLGEIEMRKGDRGAAHKAFSAALANNQTAPVAVRRLVTLELAAHRPDEATRLLETHLAKHSDDAQVQVAAGRAYADMGQLSKSEAALRKAIALDSSTMEAYHVLGQVLVRQKKLGAARAAYEEQLALRPNDVGTLTMIGMILLNEGKLAEARARFEKAVAVDSRAAVALNNLAFFDAEAGTNLDVALSRVQTAKSMLPDEPDVDDTLGWIYVKKGLPALAIAPLEQAVRKDPKNAIYHYHLGVAHAKNGDALRARSALERALQIPGFPNAADAKRVLAELGSR